MRILHTSDWHLGVTLKDHPRDFEHDRFLSWLTQRLVDGKFDAIVIAGDIFDNANPPSRALTLWYGWLAEVIRLLPDLQLVVIGGNHDSAARLDAPAELLRALRIHTVGGLGRLEDGQPDIGPTLVPLRNAAGEVCVVLGAVPFLGACSTFDVQRVYERVVDAMRAEAPPTAALMLTGHLYAAGAKGAHRSKDSEREMVGGVEATSVNVFPPDVAYTALGHLHLPQQPAENVWYAGSPIPMSFSEQDYAHRVLQIDIEAAEGGRARVLTTSIAIPRSVEMQTWPSRTGAMSVAEATLRIAALPQGERGEDGWPLVQIRLAAGATAVDKRALDERAVGKRLRLLHVDIEKSVTQSDDAAPRARLEDVSPQIVFEDAWRQAHPEDPNIPPDVAAAFAEAVAAYTQVQA